MLSTLPVLIVCAHEGHREKAAEIVRHLGLQPTCCASLLDARALVARQSFQFVLCHDDLPDCNLRTALRVLSSSTGGLSVIVLSHLADWDAYMKAMNAGAFDYIVCPPDPVESERILRLAQDHSSLGRRASGTAA